MIFYPGPLHELLVSPHGPVGLDLAARAVRVESQAKVLCPVDTGRLRSSITHAVGVDGQGLYADIGTNVVYGIFQELGTRYMSAQPYLVPALSAAL